MAREQQSGITVQCVACHRKQTLSFEEAAELPDMPVCEFCLMPMVAISAAVKNTRRAAK